MVEHLPSVCQALGCNADMAKLKQNPGVPDKRNLHGYWRGLSHKNTTLNQPCWPCPLLSLRHKKIFVLMVQNTSLPFTAIVQAVRGTEWGW